MSAKIACAWKRDAHAMSGLVVSGSTLTAYHARVTFSTRHAIFFLARVFFLAQLSLNRKRDCSQTNGYLHGLLPASDAIYGLIVSQELVYQIVLNLGACLWRTHSLL